MKQSTVFKILGGVAAVAAGGAFAYSRATRPPVINAKVPEPAKPVDLARYLGKWFELARHENRFEKGLDAVTAIPKLEVVGSKVGELIDLAHFGTFVNEPTFVMEGAQPAASTV